MWRITTAYKINSLTLVYFIYKKQKPLKELKGFFACLLEKNKMTAFYINIHRSVSHLGLHQFRYLELADTNVLATGRTFVIY